MLPAASGRRGYVNSFKRGFVQEESRNRCVDNGRQLLNILAKYSGSPNSNPALI